MTETSEDLWIFAYGSLMWRPDFVFEEQCRGRMFGYHRALCIYSHHHRGTAERPGLVLGLDRGGSCVGLCFRIAAARRAATLEAVRIRELVSGVYAEIAAPVRLDDGRRIAALAYAARRDHAQYAGALAPPDVTRLVAQGVGEAGANVDYVRNTHAHLDGLGIADARLAAVVAALGRGSAPRPPEGAAEPGRQCSGQRPSAGAGWRGSKRR